MTVAARPRPLVPTGLPARPRVPWGTHLCHFFRTSDDLLATLVPFFAAGFANGERCLWVADDPIDSALARVSLRSAIPGFEALERDARIEIIDRSASCWRADAFDAGQAVERWLAREAQALEAGFSGLRLTGNVRSLDVEAWSRFSHYESCVHDAFRARRIIAMCSYPLDRLRSHEVLDVIRNHGFAIIQRDGVWESTDAAERILPPTTGRALDAGVPPHDAQDGEWTHAARSMSEGALALAELRLAHRRLSALQGITASLSQALTVQDVGRVVISEMARGVGAARSIVAVPDSGEMLVMLAHDGLSGDESVEYQTLPLSARLPVVESYRTGRPIWLSSPVEIAGTYPELLPRSPSRSIACVPVIFDGRVLGVIGLGFLEPRAFDAVEQGLLYDVSRQVAGALERARLHDAVRISQEQLHQANRRKDEFMAVLAHELRNPLAPMLTALQVMKLRGDRTCERERALIERQIMYVSRLVDDLLDVSRITRGKFELRRHPVELAAVLAQAIEVASPLVQQRHHRLVVDVPAERFWLEADGVRLSQALANLLTNAAKYTHPGGLITIRLAREGSDVLILVTDDGIGIPADMLAGIFEPFVQVERTVERSQGGLGLGLTLVKTLVELHGGSVRASSPGPGRGSEFTVRLQALPAGDRESATDSATGGGLSRNGKSGRRVLVVDDNPDGADSLAEVLRLLGHDADVAYDGRSAVTKALNDGFDLVLLDINLPGIDGYEVARRIRTEAPEARHRFVAMTGFGTEEDHARSRQEGFIAHLVKPVDHDQLMGIIENI